MRIPSNNQWTQTNEGDSLGVLHTTRNIDLTTPGKAKLAKKSVAIVNPDYPTSNDMDFGINIIYFNSTYNVVHVSGVRTFDLLSGAVGTTGSDPTPSIYGDAIMFNDLLHVSTSTSLSAYTGASWNNTLEANTASYPHPMEIFDSLPTYKLAIGNVNTVKVLDTSYANGTALTLPEQYIVTSLAYSNSYLYVGTRNKYGGDAGIFIWSGSGTNAQYFVPVSGNWIYSVKPYKGSVCAVLSSGEVVYVNGTSAQHLCAFPVFYQQNVTWQNDTDSDYGRIFNRGVCVDGDKIYFNVNAKVNFNQNIDYLPGFESGIWLYEPRSGLSHLASSTREAYVKDTGLTVTNSVITTSTAHNLKTGDSVIFTSVSGLSGIDTNKVYYVYVASTTTIQLAKTRRGLTEGTYLTITGTAGASDILVYSPNVDYFQYGRVSSGAIVKPTSSASFLKNWNSPIIWTAGVQTSDVSTQSHAVNIITDSFNVGHIETQRIYSQNIEQTWNHVYSFIDSLELDNEKVIVKYRTEDESGYPTDSLLGAWLTTDTINSNNTTTDDWSYVQEGDEAMITDGYGRGYSAHVTSVTISSGTTSVTLDESIGTVNQPVRVSFTNYRKCSPSDTSNTEKNIAKAIIGKNSSWIQLKVELRGTNVAVNMLELSNIIQKGS